MSKSGREVTNFGLYAGSAEVEEDISERILDAAKALGVKRVIVSECGHAYDNLRFRLANLLNSDEGIGVHAVRQLQARYPSSPVTIADGGTLGLNLLPLVEDATHLLLLDAVDAGRASGTLIELIKEEILIFGGYKRSQHQLTFQEVLGLALIREKLPEHLHLSGIQPASLEIGVELSDVVQATLPALLEWAVAVLQDWDAPLQAEQA